MRSLHDIRGFQTESNEWYKSLKVFTTRPEKHWYHSELLVFMAFQKLAGVFSSGTSPNATSPQKPSFISPSSTYISRFAGIQNSFHEGAFTSNGH